jgi:hypothetical protein
MLINGTLELANICDVDCIDCVSSGALLKTARRVSADISSSTISSGVVTTYKTKQLQHQRSPVATETVKNAKKNEAMEGEVEYTIRERVRTISDVFVRRHNFRPLQSVCSFKSTSFSGCTRSIMASLRTSKMLSETEHSTVSPRTLIVSKRSKHT